MICCIRKHDAFLGSVGFRLFPDNGIFPHPLFAIFWQAVLEGLNWG